MTTKKSISITKANKWLNAIINKAIDIGEITTRYFTYEDAHNKTCVAVVTYYKVSENLTFKVFEESVDVIYWNNKLHKAIYWNYSL